MPASARDCLIVALDFPSSAEALAHVHHFEGQILWVKVGLELYLAAGRTVVDSLAGLGFKVFLDLKLHDIPNTVAGAVRSPRGSGASLLTVHASGGQAMLRAAQEAAWAQPNGPALLAVTVLTSTDERELHACGVPASPAEQVMNLARLALDCGIGGLVCSTEEVKLLRAAFGDEPRLVVPGIRPTGAENGDQRRVATPDAAMRAGASMLVVGRPITASQNPGEAARKILAEMERVLNAQKAPVGAF
jgi:orotidine-5'-phosphate decarboxylase